MPINQILICKWLGNTKEDQMIAKSTWSDVENAVRSLNGREYNDIYLTPDKINQQTYLSVGGGDGKYLVSGSINNEIFPTYVNPDVSGAKEIQIIVGGQSGDYPENYIVDINTALKAVKSFYESGNFENDIPWKNV